MLSDFIRVCETGPLGPPDYFEARGNFFRAVWRRMPNRDCVVVHFDPTHDRVLFASDDAKHDEHTTAWIGSATGLLGFLSTMAKTPTTRPDAEG